MQRKDWSQKWSQMSDQDLESAARYYLWLSEAFPDLHDERLREIVAEVERRGKPEILKHAKTSTAGSSARSLGRQ
ncbi:MAG: hypothetical protein LAP40_18560 [Acidobacteriia bacterium]|nr:hypothetical protein [Terriglobia bacterium]